MVSRRRSQSYDRNMMNRDRMGPRDEDHGSWDDERRFGGSRFNERETMGDAGWVSGPRDTGRFGRGGMRDFDRDDFNGRRPMGERGGMRFGRGYDEDRGWYDENRAEGWQQDREELRYGRGYDRGDAMDIQRGGWRDDERGFGRDNMGYGGRSEMDRQMNYGRRFGGQMGRGYGNRDEMFGGARDWSRGEINRSDWEGGRDDERWGQRRDLGSWNTQQEEGRGFGRLIRQGPHLGKGPRNYKRSDERIREEVFEALTYQSHLDASDVDVKVKDGEVTLTGVVQSRRDKRMAEELAEEVRGVSDVRNEIRVRREEAGKEGEQRSTSGTPANKGATQPPNGVGR